jgi:hypothetical protein
MGYLEGLCAVSHVWHTAPCIHAMEMLQLPVVHAPVGMISGLYAPLFWSCSTTTWISWSTM